MIQLAHGGGGRLSQRLLDDVFFSAFSNPSLNEHLDASLFAGASMAVTTDGYVVHPWRFPGGNIGSLAVHGTINDLAMVGAKPLVLSAAFILEEGFWTNDLAEVVESMREAAAGANVSIVAGDTKVVERGKGDGIYIVTTGVGHVVAPTQLKPRAIKPGDMILISGDVGRHGAAVLSVREGLALETPIESDSATVLEPVIALLESGVRVRCLRDVTRGGLASILNEIARDGALGAHIEEAAVPVDPQVTGICELFGLDPLYVACEGRFVAFVAPDDAPYALEVLRRFEVSKGAGAIGQVTDDPGLVSLVSRIGVERVLDLLSGEQLPRIC
jgi:hydrogenase expression/formation protein HypE